MQIFDVSIMRLALAAGTTFALAMPGHVQAGDPERGRELATIWCTACHVVADDVPGGTLGPAFSAIYTLHGRTTGQVSGWLAAPHGLMPDFGLSRQEIADLTAYIESENIAQEVQ